MCRSRPVVTLLLDERGVRHVDSVKTCPDRRFVRFFRWLRSNPGAHHLCDEQPVLCNASSIPVKYGMSLFREKISAAQWQKRVRPSRLKAAGLCNRYYIAWALVTRADDIHEDQAKTAEEVCSYLPDLIDMISAVPEPRPALSRAIRKDLVAALRFYRSSAEVAAGLCKWVVRGPGLSPGCPSEGEAQAAIEPIRLSVIAAAKRLAKAPVSG